MSVKIKVKRKLLELCKLFYNSAANLYRKCSKLQVFFIFFFEILYSFQDDYTLMEEFIYMLSVGSPHSQTYIPYSHQPKKKLVRNLIIQYFSLSFLVVTEASIMFPHVLPFNFSKIWTVYDPFL